MNKIELPNVKQLPGESDYNFQQRCVAIHYLGSKWILAQNIQKPAVVAWRG